MNTEELIELQEKINNKRKKINIIFIIIYIIIAFFTLSLLKGFILIYFMFFELIFIFIISLFVKAIVTGKESSKFSQEYKNIFVRKYLDKTFTNVNYLPQSGISRNEIQLTNSLYTGDRFSSNDLLSGTYNDISFTQSDIHIEEEHTETDSDGNRKTEYRTIFLGKWITYNLKNPIDKKILITHKSIYNTKNKLLKRIKTEDEEFNKKYEIYSEDELFASKFITPSLITQILNISEDYNCQIMLYFTNNLLHVAIETNKDSFEYNIKKEIDEFEIKDNIKNEIKLITVFVDKLKLN